MGMGEYYSVEKISTEIEQVVGILTKLAVELLPGVDPSGVLGSGMIS